MALDRHSAARGGAREVSDSTVGVPGKRTLAENWREPAVPARSHRAASGASGATESSPAPPAASVDAMFGGHMVQTKRDATSPGSAQDVREAAARGVEAPSTGLPHAAAIQASFGPAHDLSHVQAHVGGAAAEACHHMGATAFAAGHHVAFAGAPDLHTAAHEAAHVIQQAQGVHLYEGVGSDGDAYERHADGVADRVVAGESAAELLSARPQSQPASGLGSSPGVQRRSAVPIVQRDEATAATPAQGAGPGPAGPPSTSAAGPYQLNELARTKFKTDLMDKVNDGAKPDPKKVADLPKGCIVKILGSLFNNLAYRVVITGFDSASVGLKGTEGVVSQAFIERGVQPAEDTLADDVRIAGYVAEAKSQQAAIAGMTPDDRRTTYGKLVNKRLGEIGVPPCKIISGGDDNQFSSADWTLAITARLDTANLSDNEVAGKAAATFYHEARHAEQSFRIAQYLADLKPGTDDDRRKFIKLMTELDIADLAIEQALHAPLPPQYAAQAKDWYLSEYGSGRAKRIETLEKMRAGDPAAQAAYRNLPEEKDAFAAGGEVFEQYRAAK